MKHFSAPWGRSLFWMSLLATVFCVALTFGGPLQYFALPEKWQETFVDYSFLALLLGSAPFIIRGYTVTADALLIHRLFWNTRISLQTLTSVESMPNAMRSSLRTFGNGGLYSFTGWHRNKTLGNYRAYVTDLTRTVVLRFKDRTIVLSPGTPDEFVEALKAHIPVTPP